MNRSIVIWLLLAFLVGLSSCSSTKVGKTKLEQENELSEEESLRLKSLFFEALKEKSLNNIATAQSYFEQCLTIDPNHGASIFELANIYQAQNRLADAILFLERAIHLDPDNKWYLQSLVILYEKTKQFDKAIHIYDRLIEVEPEVLAYYEGRARMYLYKNDLKRGMKAYDVMEDKFGVLEPISMQKQRIFIGLKKYDDAIEEAQKLVNMAPNSSKYYNNLADVYRKAGKNEEAMRTYEKLLEMDPGNAFVQLSMASYFMEGGEKDKGKDLLRKAFRNPDLDYDSKARLLFNDIVYQNVNNKKVEPFTFELIDSMKLAHPDNAKILAIEGDLYFENKELDKSLAAYKSSLDLDQDQFLVWNRILFIYSDQQDWGNMLEDGNQAVDLFPNQATIYYLTGIAANQLKDYDRAVELLSVGKDFVVDNQPLLIQFYSTLGEAHHSLKNYKESDEAFDYCLKLDPENILVLNNYSYYLSLRGVQLEKAKKMSRKTIDKQPDSPTYLDTYAWVLFKNKEYEEAKKWMGFALNNGGDSESILVEHYGDILYMLKDVEGALKYWKRAKELGKGTDLLDEKIETRKYVE